MTSLPSVAQQTQELIRFDTTHPPGDEAACVRYIWVDSPKHSFQTSGGSGL
jgi:hypothetical protein